MGIARAVGQCLVRMFGTANVRMVYIVPKNTCSYCMVRYPGDRRIPWPVLRPAVLCCRYAALLAVRRS